jgi:hypothetical protein
VLFGLVASGETTTVKLTHANVATDAVTDFSDGWRDFYFEPIKQLLESEAD